MLRFFLSSCERFQLGSYIGDLLGACIDVSLSLCDSGIAFFVLNQPLSLLTLGGIGCLCLGFSGVVQSCLKVFELCLLVFEPDNTTTLSAMLLWNQHQKITCVLTLSARLLWRQPRRPDWP